MIFVTSFSLEATDRPGSDELTDTALTDAVLGLVGLAEDVSGFISTPEQAEIVNRNANILNLFKCSVNIGGLQFFKRFFPQNLPGFCQITLL